jgi:hypothetical protein
MPLFLRTIDDFPAADVVAALRAMTIEPETLALLRAFATAENRCVSRFELARAVESDDVDEPVALLGTFAAELAGRLDASLSDDWESDDGEANGWMLFLSHDPPRWTEAVLEEDDDEFVVVMRETLARALDAAQIADYQPLDEEADEMLATYEGVMRDGLWQPSDPLEELSDAEESLTELSANDRSAVVAARFGRGPFRSAVIEVWEGRCAVTGAAFVPALVASPIVPWADATNDERIDPYNALLLSGTLDRLFDGGFITFEEDGAIRISDMIPEEEYPSLGIDSSLRLRAVPQRSLGYLARHREFCFLNFTGSDEDAESP